MAHYNLKDGVYIIRGTRKHCIYNSNDGIIYHINSDTLELLETIHSVGEIDGSLVEEKQLLDTFKNAGLIELSDKKKIYSDIKTESINKVGFAWIEVTNKCNLQCIHCYEEAKPTNDKEMSYDDFQLLISRLLMYGVKRIQFIGGEPFILRDKLIKMIEYCSGKFESIEVFTNGTLIHEEWVKFLKSKNIRIALSIYSYDKEQHDKVTQVKGAFEKTNKTIALLIKYKVTYRICAVEMKEIEIGDNTDNLYRLQKRDIVRLTGRANFSLYNESMLRRKIITELNFKNKQTIKEIRNRITGHNCFSRNIYIDCNLEVFPCVMERRFVHGNMKHRELDALINDDIRSLTKDFIDGCNQCEYRYFCYDCRPDSMGAEKYAKPWYCSYEPATGEWTDPEIFIDSLMTHFNDENECKTINTIT